MVEDHRPEGPKPLVSASRSAAHRLLGEPDDPHAYEVLVLGEDSTLALYAGNQERRLACQAAVAARWSWVHARRARFLWERDNANGARAALRFGLRHSHDHGLLYRELARIQRETGDGGATASILRSLVFRPSDGLSYRIAHMLHEFSNVHLADRNNGERAIICLDRRRQQTDIGHTALSLSKTYQRLGESRRALKMLETTGPVFNTLGWTSRLGRERARHDILLRNFDRAEAILDRLLRNLNSETLADTLCCQSLLSYERGDTEAYRYLVNSDFIWRTEARSLFDPPEFKQFNDYLSRFILGHPSLTTLRHGFLGNQSRTAYQGSKSMIHDDDKGVAVMIEILMRKVREYLARLPRDPDHPFLRNRDSPLRLSRLWGNVYHEINPETPHHHGDSYITAIYFVRQPVSDDPASREGWLEIGRPEPPFHIDDSDVVTIQPRAGDMVFIPSHVHHVVKACHFSEPRISVACDFKINRQGA